MNFKSPLGNTVLAEYRSDLPPEHAEVASGGFQTLPKASPKLWTTKAACKCRDIEPGDTLYISHSARKQPWFHSPVEIAGAKYWLIPIEDVAIFDGK